MRKLQVGDLKWLKSLFVCSLFVVYGGNKKLLPWFFDFSISCNLLLKNIWFIDSWKSSSEIWVRVKVRFIKLTCIAFNKKQLQISQVWNVCIVENCFSLVKEWLDNTIDLEFIYLLPKSMEKTSIDSRKRKSLAKTVCSFGVH